MEYPSFHPTGTFETLYLDDTNPNIRQYYADVTKRTNGVLMRWNVSGLPLPEDQPHVALHYLETIEPIPHSELLSRSPYPYGSSPYTPQPVIDLETGNGTLQLANRYSLFAGTRTQLWMNVMLGSSAGDVTKSEQYGQLRYLAALGCAATVLSRLPIGDKLPISLRVTNNFLTFKPLWSYNIEAANLEEFEMLLRQPLPQR